MVQIDRRTGQVTLALGQYRLLLGLVGAIALFCFGFGFVIGTGFPRPEQGALAAPPVATGELPVDTPEIQSPAAPDSAELASAPEVSPQPNPVPQQFGVRVGIFGEPENAARMERGLLANGRIPSVVVRSDRGTSLWFVYAGVVASEDEARTLASQLATTMGLETFIEPWPADSVKQ